MKSYNQQIEDAYTASRRQGDMMRNPAIERSSGQDRQNRYREDRYQWPAEHRGFDQHYRGEADRADRYGYERSLIYNSHPLQNAAHGRYPETYRPASGGYMSEHVGDDRGRRDYTRSYDSRSTLYGGNFGPHRGKGPKNYKRADARIREDVMDRLTDDDAIDATEIDVEVKDGDVLLSGTVSSREEKRRAEDISENVIGVVNVENRLRVAATHYQDAGG